MYPLYSEKNSFFTSILKLEIYSHDKIGSSCFLQRSCNSVPLGVSLTSVNGNHSCIVYNSIQKTK